MGLKKYHVNNVMRIQLNLGEKRRKLEYMREDAVIGKKLPGQSLVKVRCKSLYRRGIVVLAAEVQLRMVAFFATPLRSRKKNA